MAPTTTTTTPVRRSARVASRAAAAAAAESAAPPASSAANQTKKQTKKKSKTHGHVKSVPAQKKQKLSGLQSIVDSSAPLGVVDPAANLTDGSKIATFDGVPADAMLVLVDPEQNSDKYFVLQCIERDGNGNGNGDQHKYCVFSRWGRTGTVGQALLQDFDDAATAEQAFDAKFGQKTGLTWTERDEPYQGGKYRFIVQDFAQKLGGYANGQWQYYVDDGVDGKVTGWYDYDANGSMQVEMLFHQNAQNNNAQLSQRQVASGIFTYHVDLDQMTQTNTSHPARKCRRIRRVVVNNHEEEEGEEEADRTQEEGKEEEEDEEEAERAPVGAVTSTTMTTPPRPRRGNAAAPTPMVSPSPARRRAGGTATPSSSS